MVTSISVVRKPYLLPGVPAVTYLRLFFYGIGVSLFLGCSETQSSTEGATDPDTADTASGTDSIDTSTGTGQIIDSDSGQALPCNGLIQNCTKPFNRVVFPTAHNAAAYQSPPFSVSYQEVSIYQQLLGGIRGLELEVHLVDNKLTLCEGDCDSGQLSFVLALDDINRFLTDNTREMAVLFIDAHTPLEQLASALSEMAAAQFFAVLEPAVPYPTIEELLVSNQRLVIFVTDQTSQTDDAGVTDGDEKQLPLWLHDGAQIRQTSTSFTAVGQVNCNLDASLETTNFYKVNHFLQTSGSTEDVLSNATTMNESTYLTNRLSNCTTEHKQMPNFVTVDFFNRFVITAINGLNR